MADLGSFGTARGRVLAAVDEPVEQDTFEWFGVRIRTAADVDDLDLIDFLETSNRIESSDLMAMVAIKDGLRLLVDPADFDQFWRLAHTNRQTTDDLLQVWTVLVEAETGRPTRQPSGSSHGLPSTVESSPDGSTSQASRGRPDLQLLHDEARASRERIQAAVAAAG